MKQNSAYRSVVSVALATAALLLVPLLAMQFSDELVWNLPDFIIAGVLIFGAGLTYEFISKKGGTMAFRAATGIAIVTALLLIWMNLAVGLIGNEAHPANLLYIGVLVTGIIGATLARLQPHGMARALWAMALAQALVPVIALAIWSPPDTSGVMEILGVNAIFIVSFAASAWLFRSAGASNQLDAA